MSQKTYQVIQYGLGPIGVGMAAEVRQRGNLSLVGAVDVAPDKVGRDVGELMPSPERTGLCVVATLEEVLFQASADVVIHCTGSFLSAVTDQIIALAEAGLNVVTTCEELFYPYFHHPQEAQRIDASARAHGVTVLGTGVNPGFVMDLLPMVFSSVCRRVEKAAIQRVVDASTRRLPLQRKIGAGMAREEFLRQAEQGSLGHIGLVESVAFLADAWGFSVDRIAQELQPRLATGILPWAGGLIQPGQVTGIDQRARGFIGDEVVLDLHQEMFIGAELPHDRIVITGDPGLTVMVEGGTAGDAATVGTAVNWISPVVQAPPGLVTVKDLAAPGGSAR